jgi:hypothetical protein
MRMMALQVVKALMVLAVMAVMLWTMIDRRPVTAIAPIGPKRD